MGLRGIDCRKRSLEPPTHRKGERMYWLIGFLLIVMAISGVGTNISNSINYLGDSIKEANGYVRVVENDDKWWTWESAKWVKP